MQRLAFIIIYPFLWLISLLPFPLLYFLSDIVCIILYRILGYRKKVVRGNLALVFPEKSTKELRKIEKHFYKHLCDLFLEMIKSINISTEQMKKRFVFPNLEVLREYEEQQKSIILMCAHYANWEWMNILEEYVKFKGFGVYKPLKNKYFDKLIRDIREKRNTILIPSKQAIGAIRRNEKNGITGIYAFPSDQSPKMGRDYFWTDFMNVKVPCFTGGEQFARKFDLPMLYLKVEKVKRGHYQAFFVPLHEGKVSDLPTNKGTELFYREIEKQIAEAPEYYYWVHKRWKHKDKVPEKYQ